MHLRDSKRCEELMRLAGLSQRQLAQQAHVSQAFISMVIRGRRGVRPVTAWRMASALEVYVSELFAPDPHENNPAQPPSATPELPSQRGRLKTRSVSCTPRPSCDCAPSAAGGACGSGCVLSTRRPGGKVACGEPVSPFSRRTRRTVTPQSDRDAVWEPGPRTGPSRRTHQPAFRTAGPDPIGTRRQNPSPVLRPLTTSSPGPRPVSTPPGGQSIVPAE